MFKQKPKTRIRLNPSCPDCGFANQSSTCSNCQLDLEDPDEHSKSKSFEKEHPFAKSDEIDNSRSRSGLSVIPIRPVEPRSSSTSKRQSGEERSTKKDGEEYAAMQANVQQNPVRFAGFLRRALALCIDQGILFTIQIFILVIGSAQWFCLDSTKYLSLQIGFVIALVVSEMIFHYWLYTALFEHSALQSTPGKFLLGLYVTDTRGKRVKFFGSTLRLIVQYLIVGTLTIVTGFLCIAAQKNPTTISLVLPLQLIYFVSVLSCFCMVIFDSRRQTLCDRVCNRIVVFRPDYPDTSEKPLIEKLSMTLRAIPGLLQAFPKRTLNIFCASSTGFILLLVIVLSQPVVLLAQTEKTLASISRERLPTKKFDSRIPLLYTFLAQHSFSDALTEHLYTRAIETSQGANYYKQRGYYFLSKGNLSAAESDFDKALDRAINCDQAGEVANAWFALSRVRESQGKKPEAIELCIKALQLNPYDQEIINYLKPSSAKGINFAALEQCIEGSKYKSIGLVPDFGSGEQGLKQSVAEFDRVLKAFPRCTEAHLAKAWCFSSLEIPNKKAAETSLKSAISTDDLSCEAKIKYAEFLNGEHRYKEAEHQLALAQTLKDSCQIHAVRSEVFKSENKYDLSVTEISIAISMRPNDENLLEKRADLFASQSKYKESMRDLDVAIELSEGYTNKIVDLTMKKADILIQNQQFENALAVYDKVIPFDSGILEKKGTLLSQMGRVSDAMECFTQLISALERESAWQSWWRRLTFLSTDIGAALSTSNQIRIESAYTERARLHVLLGQFEKALQDQQHAAALSPGIYGSDLGAVAAAYAGKLLDEGKFQEALTMEDSLLNKYSSFTGTEFANVLCEKGLYRDAADWLLKVRAVKADPESLLRYAAVLRKISEPGKATPQELQAIRAAIAAASKLISEEASSDNYSLRAKAYLFAHQPDRALKDINKALLLENNYSNHDVKSRILIVKRSYRAALAELDRSWSDYTKEFDDPGDRDEFDGYERAAALFALDQDVAANTLLAKLAKKLSPGERFLIRGSVLADAGRREDSLLAFSQAKKLGKFENPLESLHF